MTKLDAMELREAFGSFMTGVTVVTALDADGSPVGFTANSFSSVSLDPPLLLVCPGQYLSSFAVFQSCTRFCVSVLAEGQEDISNTFAGFKGDRFARTPHTLDAHGLPLVEGAAATFSCTTTQALTAGDHAILIGEITDFACSGARGLGYVGGRYFSLGLERGVTPDGSALWCGAIVERDGHVLLENSGLGLRPPQVAAFERRKLRDTLATHLENNNIHTELNQVYSSFHDAEHDAHLTFFLATALSAIKPDTCDWIPVRDLADLNYASPAIETMMSRYALEAESQNFTLYLGDAEHGDTYELQERN